MKFPVFGKLGLHPPFKAAAALNIAVHKLTFREIRFVPAIASAAPGNGAFCITALRGPKGDEHAEAPVEKLLPPGMHLAATAFYPARL